jgi:cell division protein DivIC
MLKKLPGFVRNFYFLTSFFFLVWMLFIDSNNLISQISHRRKTAELENQQKFYVEQIKIVEKDRRELLTNDKMLEKFAREKYFMKKPSEDLYIVVPQ